MAGAGYTAQDGKDQSAECDASRPHV